MDKIFVFLSLWMFTIHSYGYGASNELVINTSYNKPLVYDIWPAPQRFNLTYCVSDEFGEFKDQVVEAMAVATEDWMDAANVEFHYLPEQDEKCTPQNSNVVFDIRPAYEVKYAARAFFPSSPRRSRNILVNADSFRHPQVVIDGIMRHELGHVLGFRHEHIRDENDFVGCEETGPYKSLTEYDKYSVMHYPQCGGFNSFSNLVLTEYDKEGAAMMYPSIQASL